MRMLLASTTAATATASTAAATTRTAATTTGARTAATRHRTRSAAARRRTRAWTCTCHRTAARRATGAVHLGLPPRAVAAEGVAARRAAPTRTAAGALACRCADRVRPAGRTRAADHPATGGLRRCASCPAAGRPVAAAAARIARARGGGGLADGAADLAGLLVGLPRGAAARRQLARAAAAVDVAGVDVGVAVDVDVGVPAVVRDVVAAVPGRPDRGAPDDAGGERGTGRIRVVVRRVGRRVVAPRRSRRQPRSSSGCTAARRSPADRPGRW